MKKDTIHLEEAPESTNEGVNMGRNIKYVRESKNIYQKELAAALDISTKTMSRIEEKETIKDEELLNKIANVLECDVNFLKFAKLGEVIKNYSILNPANSPIVNSAENSQDEVQQKQNNVNGQQEEIGEDQNINNNESGEQENTYITNNNCPIEEIKDLFLKILENKDKQTSRLMDEIKELREDIGKIKQEK